MGYGLNGVCHPLTSEALNAFKVAFTAVSSTASTTFTGTPTISAGGNISYSYRVTDLLGSNVRTGSATLQLPTCTETTTQYELSAIVWVSVLFFAAFMGFRTGFRP